MAVQIAWCAPRTEIDHKSYGHIVYGIRAEVVGYSRFPQPLRLFVSMHAWEWRARRAARRWLRENGANRG
jgi:hypothetical protein